MMNSNEKPAQHAGENGGPPEQSHASGANGNLQTAPDKSEPHEKEKKMSRKEQDKKDPPGGYDATPIPNAPPGYTVKITFHRATNLPMADINSLSSDPFVLAQINHDLPARHKEDPLLRMRTHTVRRNTDPEWNTEWIVANIPQSGFKLKARIYDEDPADHDDRLGNVHVHVDHVDENWGGIHNQGYKVMKKAGSKRAYFVRLLATCVRKTRHLNGMLYVSVEVLGRTDDPIHGRVYTIGPNWWTRHYSPLLGRIAHRKEQDDDDTGEPNKPERYKYAMSTSYWLRSPVLIALQFPGKSISAPRPGTTGNVPSIR